MESYKNQNQRKNSIVLDELPLAIAYVPFQKWQNLYSPEKGFHAGTIFQDLDFPFLGKGGYKR